MKTLLSTLLIGLIRLYQIVLSPWIGHQCRFTPSCSHYAIEAIRTHGAGKGTWLALRRIARCNPFCQGGHDPVPDADTPHAPHAHPAEPHIKPH